MESNDTNQLVPLPDVLTGLIQGVLPLKVALDTWRSHHGLTYGQISLMLPPARGGVAPSPGAVSSWIHLPKKHRRVGLALGELIGYEERSQEREVKP